MRSARMGLRLYGMADEPIWCFSNGSSSSSNDWAMRRSFANFIALWAMPDRAERK